MVATVTLSMEINHSNSSAGHACAVHGWNVLFSPSDLDLALHRAFENDGTVVYANDRFVY